MADSLFRLSNVYASRSSGAHASRTSAIAMIAMTVPSSELRTRRCCAACICAPYTSANSPSGVLAAMPATTARTSGRADRRGPRCLGALGQAGGDEDRRERQGLGPTTGCGRSRTSFRTTTLPAIVDIGVTPGAEGRSPSVREVPYDLGGSPAGHVTLIASRQWSLGPHSSTPFKARALTPR